MSARQYATAALLILAVAVVYGLTFVPGQGWDDDSSAYINNAKNLADGHRYGQTTFVPNSAFPFLPAITPPGLPLLLAPIYRVFGLNLNAMKIEGVVFLLVALCLAAIVCAGSVPYVGRLLIVTALAFHPLVWNLKDRVLSDIPFLMFVLLTLWLVERLDVSHPARAPAYAREALAGAAMFAAFLIRPLGIVLPGALVVRDIVHKQRPRSTVRVLGVLAVLVVGQLALFPLDPTAGDRLPRSIDALRQNAQDLALASSVLWRVGDSRLVSLLVAYIIDITAALGIGARFRAAPRTSMTEPFFVLYVLALVCFTAHMHLRYLLPILPLVLYYSLVGVNVLGTWRSWGQPLALSAWIGGASAIALTAADVYEQQHFEPRVDSASAQDMVQNIRDRATLNDLIVFGHPRTLALWTARRTTLLHGAPDASLIEYWQSVGASYVLAGPPGVSHEFDAIVGRNPSRFTIAYENPDYRLYRILAPGADDRGTRP
jgi:hypothetical protein